MPGILQQDIGGYNTSFDRPPLSNAATPDFQGDLLQGTTTQGNSGITWGNILGALLQYGSRNKTSQALGGSVRQASGDVTSGTVPIYNPPNPITSPEKKQDSTGAVVSAALKYFGFGG